jgi:hypothetical protein
VIKVPLAQQFFDLMVLVRRITGSDRCCEFLNCIHLHKKILKLFSVKNFKHAEKLKERYSEHPILIYFLE